MSEETKSHVLKVHHLKPAPGAKTAKTRVGRGEGSKGKTAGRGTKGTKARYQVPDRFEGGQMPLHMRLPKLRGFKNRQRVEFVALNVGQLKTYAVNGKVSPDTLAAKGLIEAGAKVKLLANGEITQQLEVHAHRVSAAAKQKIESAGGSVVLLDAGNS